MKNERCEVCDGAGYVAVLLNPECAFAPFEQPQYKKQPCEDCDATLERVEAHEHVRAYREAYPHSGEHS